MRALALSIALLGIFALLLLQTSLSPELVSSYQELNSLLQNQKVILTGRVSDTKITEANTIFYLDNNLSLFCTSCPKLLYTNKTITALGIVETFPQRHVRLLRIYAP